MLHNSNYVMTYRKRQTGGNPEEWDVRDREGERRG